MNKFTGRTAKFGALSAAAVLALTACGGGDDGNGGSDEAEDADPISLGIIEAWTDGLSLAYVWQAILEEEGYEVEIDELSEAAPLYTAVAQGDYDVYPSAWPEVTHEDYMEEYGDQLEDLGAYYDNAKLTFAVPEYTDVDSIADLNDNADLFDGQIIGIEPGAGLTRITNESVFPEYDLGENFELVESSTTAMISELQQATDNDEDIVVTLWRPFWANTAFPVKDLEDPEGALGEAETLNFVANADFSDEYPDVAEWMGNFKLNDEEYGELEDLVTVENEDDPAAGAEQWIEDHRDLVDGIKE